MDTATRSTGDTSNSNHVLTMGAEVVNPPRRHRPKHRTYDRPMEKDRVLVERFFSRLKQFRCMANRYEDLARNLCPSTPSCARMSEMQKYYRWTFNMDTHCCFVV